MSKCCSSLAGDVTRPGMTTTLCASGSSWRVVRSAASTLVCLGRRGVNVYISTQPKTEIRLVSSVTASPSRNRRKRGSGVWRKPAHAAALAVCTVPHCIQNCSVNCLVKSLRMQIGQWKVQQQIGKCFTLCSHQLPEQMSLYQVLETFYGLNAETMSTLSLSLSDVWLKCCNTFALHFHDYLSFSFFSMIILYVNVNAELFLGLDLLLLSQYVKRFSRAVIITCMSQGQLLIIYPYLEDVDDHLMVQPH